MSSNPLPTIGPTMPIPLPPPIPPAMPMLPPTTALPVIPPPNHSSPLPPISTISTPPVTNVVLNSNNQLNETVKAHSGNDGSTVTPNGEATFDPKINQEGEHVVDGTDSSDGFQPRLVLRVKTKRTMESMEPLTFEKQDISKNDSYCWVCHEGGEVLCCDKCPRVFHLQCSGLDTPPDDEAEWICPVCKTISRKQKRSRPHGLKDLLLLTVQRMMFPGTEIFQKSVPEDIFDHYKEYIFHPMHLGMIREKASRNDFLSTREFLHVTEWILHNCIIYNGGKHALTKIAKGIVKICKEDVREIELCPSCYGLAVKQPVDWFCIPCNPPHRVVLAKVRGYPLWPAKLISETTDKCDVRFFGQHDRSLVPRSSIQDLNGPPPTPSTKTTHWGIAMDELTKYRQNINQMVQQMALGKSAEKFISEKIEEAPKQPIKPREPPIGSFPPIPRKVHVKPPGRSHPPTAPAPPVSTANYNGFKEEMEHRKPDLTSFTVSNHIPCSPQIVMVNPSFSEFDDLTIHGNSASFPHSNDTSGSRSNPSSPDSDIGLRIDLDGSDTEQKRGDKCLASNTYQQKLIKKRKIRNNQSDGYYDSSLGTSSSMDVRMITPTVYRQPSSRPGDVLSLITDNLAEKRALELKGRGMVNGPSSGVGGSPDDDDIMMEDAFSSVYPRDKLAIAVVDPDAKRSRDTKRKKRPDCSPIKRHSKRINNKATDNATPPPSGYYDTRNLLITGSDTYETSSSYIPCASGNVYDEVVEDVAPMHLGEGLLADTIRNVDTSYCARIEGLTGKRDDMGYHYFSEKMMSSIKTVINEMMSMFESKGKMGAKQIKEQLHTAWPVPDSRSQMEALKRELQAEMRRSLELVKTNAEVEREQIVRVVRRQMEAEKELAISETKKKKWCTYCFKEAQYNCCWNANYCNEACQQAHWPEHSAVCMQVQNQQPQQGHASTPLPTRALPVAADAHKYTSPATTEPDLFSFPSINDHHDELLDGSNSSTSQSIPQTSEDVSGEFPIAMVTSRHAYHDNVVPFYVPEKEPFIISDHEMEQHTVLIEQYPNTGTAFLQHSSPVITHSIPPHHIIPVTSSTPSPLPPQPISPATPPQVSDHAPSVMHVGNNTFSWPYQQQQMIPMSHDFSQALPLLPQVPSLTPTTQSNAFFRVF